MFSCFYADPYREHYIVRTPMRERGDCPACEDGTLRPIIYGLVRGGELREKVDRGEVVLGGCQVGEDAPDWACNDCGRRFTEAEGGAR